MIDPGAIVKQCKHCGSDIPLKRRKSYVLFCKSACRYSWERQQWKRANPGRLKGDTSTTGAAHEMKVCADLMVRGYEVFRACSPSASCDLMILRNKKIFRVQVTTGSITSSGKVCWPTKNPQHHDLLAVVTHQEIVYMPELPIYEGDA